MQGRSNEGVLAGPLHLGLCSGNEALKRLRKSFWLGAGLSDCYGSDEVSYTP